MLSVTIVCDTNGGFFPGKIRSSSQPYAGYTDATAHGCRSASTSASFRLTAPIAGIIQRISGVRSTRRYAAAHSGAARLMHSM